MTEVLAKSDPKISLKQHISDGLSVLKHLKESFPKSPICAKKKNFWELLELSVIMHDLGKAHQEFQKVLLGQGNEWHSQRHELFSLPFIESLRISNNDKLLISRVVAAHHRSYSILQSFVDSNYDEDTEEFKKEFDKVRQKDATDIANSFQDSLYDDHTTISPLHPNHIILAYKCLTKKYVMGKIDVIPYYETLLLLMGAFHHCDHLSSAFITEFPIIEVEKFAFLDELKLSLSQKNLNLYFHQNKASETLGNTILTAPTGSGKTETSMLWLRNQLSNIGQGRTFYVLPFTASINAMYERLRDPQKGLGNEAVGMLHGKLNAYLYESFYEDKGNVPSVVSKIKQLQQTFKTLETPLKIVTPFQLLKHLFGLKGFEKGIFEWVGGYFIFDEIHAYDPEITAQIIVLLEFLSKKMEAKIFIMTATLPTFLKQRIGNAIGSFEEIQAEQLLYESFTRHRVLLFRGKLNDNLSKIRDDLDSDKSVLVVCNTVDQAREVYDAFESIVEKLLIHGRFSAKDRASIEQQLHKNPPKLLIGTQAIEVSLNIDYDVIYTEPAPLDALIQRFGRVNRKREKAPCPCIVFRERNEKDEYIYSEKLILLTLKVLEEIVYKNDGLIKEGELQRYIDIVYPGYDEKEQGKFDKIYHLLNLSVKNLIPFEHSKDREEDFYKQFDGIKVLPSFYEKEYQHRLSNFDFIGAEQLKVSIRKNWFARLIDSKEIKIFEQIVYKSESSNKNIVKKYYRIHKKYRPETGLDLNTDEDPKYLVNELDIML